LKSSLIIECGNRVTLPNTEIDGKIDLLVGAKHTTSTDVGAMRG